MSISTIIYLRKKGEPLLEYKDYPGYEELNGKNTKEIEVLYNEVKEYNQKVTISLGCKLFSHGTIPSSHLEVLEGTLSPMPLTLEDLNRVLAFYDEEIEDYKNVIQDNKDKIQRLEERINKTNSELYDKISSEIEDSYKYLTELQEEMEEFQYNQSQFAFVKEIMENRMNAEHYELVYLKG